MEEDRIIAEVAKRNGVLLHHGDPILQIHTMLDLHTADHQEREERLAQRDADMVARLVQVLDRAEKQAGGQLANTAARELPRAIDRMVVQRFWLYGLIGGVVIVGALGGAVAGGYWWGHRDSGREAVHLEAYISKVLSRDDAALWRTLIENNPPVEKARQNCWEDSGHRACNFGLWVEPEPATPPRQLSALPLTPQKGSR